MGIEEWVDLKSLILQKVKENGGFVNAHAHLDRAHTITLNSLDSASRHLHEKWYLVDEMKRNSTVDQIYARMARTVEEQIAQGVSAIGTFIDVDEVVGDRVIQAAQRVRDRYEKDVTLVYINQTLKGVRNPVARLWFNIAAQFVDVIGGLPAKDAGYEEEHLDIVLGAAQSAAKMAHIHVDQLNTSKERETELLVRKTMEHGMQGRVVAIHGISIAAHPRSYRDWLYKQMRKADTAIVSCPTAWIDGQRAEKLTPTHNSVTPVDELVPAGVLVALGTDNIADIYKPFTDGDMWTELRFLLESCRFYNIEELVKIATTNGRRVLGIEDREFALACKSALGRATIPPYHAGGQGLI